MKKLILMAAVICLLASCSKTSTEAPPAPPEKMTYTNFNDREVKFNTSFDADINNDGKKDFYVYTMHVGDALLKRDYKRFLFGSSIGTFFPINEEEQVPVLDSGKLIKAKAFSKYNWYEVAAIVMAQKTVTENNVHWEGEWVNANHKYLPLHIRRGINVYFGWVEVSFDAHKETLRLHKAAICQEPNRPVQAGS